MRRPIARSHRPKKLWTSKTNEGEAKGGGEERGGDKRAKSVGRGRLASVFGKLRKGSGILNVSAQ